MLTERLQIRIQFGTARKILERLLRRFSDIPSPTKSTIHAVLDRGGLVERRGRVRRRAQDTSLFLGQGPNELWCTDYKGEFLLGNHQYCYPLTVIDHANRYLLACEGIAAQFGNAVWGVSDAIERKKRNGSEGASSRPFLTN